MHNLQHPDPELLDRLRAGLLDDLADEKKALEDHLAECPSCQSSHASWQQLGPDALGPKLEPESLRHSLRASRTRAFDNADTHRKRGFAPYATAALLLIAVSIGFWVAQPMDSTDTQVTTVEAGVEIPDLYEDIDFYLWLAEQNGSSTDSEDTNPNNT